jgi:hypothetical protein
VQFTVSKFTEEQLTAMQIHCKFHGVNNSPLEEFTKKSKSKTTLTLFAENRHAVNLLCDELL